MASLSLTRIVELELWEYLGRSVFAVGCTVLRAPGPGLLSLTAGDPAACQVRGAEWLSESAPVVCFVPGPSTALSQWSKTLEQ